MQCAGTTKAGKQCSRMVKTAPALSQKLDDGDDSDEETNAPLEVFCYQHTKELLVSSGCYARKNGEWIDFSGQLFSPDECRPCINKTPQIGSRDIYKSKLNCPCALRWKGLDLNQMWMGTSTHTKYEVNPIITSTRRLSTSVSFLEEDTKTIKLKVGRAVNLVKRIDQWGKQCGSKQQVLRGFYPNPEDDHNAQTTLMKGRVKAGTKASCCHRLGAWAGFPGSRGRNKSTDLAERLIHLELADLSATQVYLDTEWPDIDSIDVSSQVTSGKRNGPKKVERCLDCGSMHKEIFEFQRWESGPNKNKEWEKIVKPVIERWGMFVELYV